jgi:membrane protein implicated in regulation of membrane protease activity
MVLVSQLLLIALALAWVIHMALIATNGAVYFVEANPVILWTEIAVTVLISLFGIVVFAMQLRRLGERRRSDDTPDERRRSGDTRDEHRS